MSTIPFVRASEARFSRCMIPIDGGYSNENMYVRSVFDKCYNDIVDQLNSGIDYITVGGNKWVGKSLFYYYIFQRLREVFATGPIFTMVCRRGRMSECQEFHKDDRLGRTHDEIPRWDQSAIYLFDGIPGRIPQRIRAICIGEYDVPKWTAKLREYKHGLHRIPLWSLFELQEAVRILDLKISDDELVDQMRRFGPIPCFGPIDVEYLKNYLPRVNRPGEVYAKTESAKFVDKTKFRLLSLDESAKREIQEIKVVCVEAPKFCFPTVDAYALDGDVLYLFESEKAGASKSAQAILVLLASLNMLAQVYRGIITIKLVHCGKIKRNFEFRGFGPTDIKALPCEHAFGLDYSRHLRETLRLETVGEVIRGVKAVRRLEALYSAGICALIEEVFRPLEWSKIFDSIPQFQLLKG